MGCADVAAAGMDGIRVAATGNGGLQVLANGRVVRLAVIDDDGTVLAAGDGVAAAVEDSAVQAYRLLLQARGHLRAVSGPVGLRFNEKHERTATDER